VAKRIIAEIAENRVITFRFEGGVTVPEFNRALRALRPSFKRHVRESRIRKVLAPVAPVSEPSPKKGV
jgi:hypothetical protein